MKIRLLSIGLAGMMLLHCVTCRRPAGPPEQDKAADIQISPAKIARIDALVDSTRVSAGIPGIGFALTQAASPLLVKGYGVRRAGATSPIEADTLFSIASLTKTFTSTALAMLVAEGRLGWDDPIVRHLPGFRTSDPWVTAHATVRDILAMRVGWLDADSIVFGQPKIQGLLDCIANAEVGAFRQEYRQEQSQAPNISYVLAGQVLEATSGKSWEEFVQARLLTPLQMQRTVTQRNVANQSNLADGHVRRAERIEVQEAPTMFQHVYPAGGLYSTARDMARWISFHLNAGRGPDGVLVSDTVLRETHKPHALLVKGLQDLFQSSGWPLAIALGWITYSYHGNHVLEIAGAWPGFNCLLLLLPERDLGLVILTNLDMAAAFPALRQIRDDILTIISE